MKCLYCNKSISLLRRLNDKEFCSDSHRVAHADEQHLAVARLSDRYLTRVDPVAAAPAEPVPTRTGSTMPQPGFVGGLGRPLDMAALTLESPVALPASLTWLCCERDVRLPVKMNHARPVQLLLTPPRRDPPRLPRSNSAAALLRPNNPITPRVPLSVISWLPAADSPRQDAGDLPLPTALLALQSSLAAFVPPASLPHRSSPLHSQPGLSYPGIRQLIRRLGLRDAMPVDWPAAPLARSARFPSAPVAPIPPRTAATPPRRKLRVLAEPSVSSVHANAAAWDLLAQTPLCNSLHLSHPQAAPPQASNPETPQPAVTSPAPPTAQPKGSSLPLLRASHLLAAASSVTFESRLAPFPSAQTSAAAANQILPSLAPRIPAASTAPRSAACLLRPHYKLRWAYHIVPLSSAHAPASLAADGSPAPASFLRPLPAAKEVDSTWFGTLPLADSCLPMPVGLPSGLNPVLRFRPLPLAASPAVPNAPSNPGAAWIRSLSGATRLFALPTSASATTHSASNKVPLQPICQQAQLSTAKAGAAIPGRPIQASIRSCNASAGMVRLGLAPSGVDPTLQCLGWLAASRQQIGFPAAAPSRLQVASSSTIRIALFPVPRLRPSFPKSDASAWVCPSESAPVAPIWLRPKLAIARERSKKKRSLSGENIERQLRDSLSKLDVSHTWSRIQFLPKDLKWVLVSLPLLIAIWAVIRPGIGSEVHNPAQTPAAVQTAQQVAEAAGQVTIDSGSSTWKQFEKKIASRASVEFDEDFRSGIASWEGKGDWSRSWGYDKTGVVRPGSFAIFVPSASLRDYVAEIKASIDKRSLLWSVRASGASDHHAFRLSLTRDGAHKRFQLDRWSVVNSKSGPVKSMPIPPQSRVPEVIYVRAEVTGDTVTTYLNDSVIDSFSDPRLPSGGLALSGAGSDRALIYSVRITHQNDFLGKLCSFLAPQPIANQGTD